MYSNIVNWNSPDGLPANPPPLDSSGEWIEEEYEPEYESVEPELPNQAPKVA